MVGCILTGHGDFAPGLASALEMVAGPQPAFEVVAFHEDGAAAFPEELASTIASLSEKCGEVVVFCDLMGGTPFNQAMLEAATRPGTEVMAGTNLPMLLECVTARTDASTAAQICDLAVEIGRMGIDHRRLDAAAGGTEDASGEDGI